MSDVETASQEPARVQLGRLRQADQDAMMLAAIMFGVVHGILLLRGTSPVIEQMYKNYARTPMDNRLLCSIRSIHFHGATGKQGSALISALVANRLQPFEIYALTRSKTSPAAQKLASQPRVHVIEGDFDKPDEIFKQVEGAPWGLFSLTTPMGKGGARREEEQGKAFTKAALDAGGKHIVFTSVERGVNSDNDPTNVPHFASKKKVEDDIKDRTSRLEGRTWTFLRPVAFHENFTNDFFGKVFFATWKLNGPDKTLQFVSTKDIGRVAADAFLSLHANPASSSYRNKSICLAGDEITPNSAAQIFRETTGAEIPSTYSFFGTAVKWMMKDDLGKMMDWFRDVGSAVDIDELRSQYPFMKDYKKWLEEESAWRKV